MYPFERFTEDAKRGLQLAQEEAERSHHSYIGTEHLLLGLLRVEHGTAPAALNELGVSIGPVRELIDARLARNKGVIIRSVIPTSRVKKVIEMSFEEAARMGHHEVDSAHILIALVMEGDGIAAHVLQDLGATAERVVAAVERTLGIAESGRGHDSLLGQRAYLAPARKTDLEIGYLRVVLHSPRIARLLKAKGLDVDAMTTLLMNQPDNIQIMTEVLNAAEVELQAAITTQDFERAARLRDKVNRLTTDLETAEAEWLDSLGS